MLKRLILLTVVGLAGCAQTGYYARPVYIEQQIYTPTRHEQCNVYAQRQQNCYSLAYPDVRAMCIEDSRRHYASCMTR